MCSTGIRSNYVSFQIKVNLIKITGRVEQIMMILVPKKFVYTEK